ncbi:hypothetical protein BH10PLA2_BH10PLA2_10090 [soil metagenome]
MVVRVELAGAARPDDQIELRFTISDTGIGIPEDKQGKIFRAFEQEDTSTTRKYGGTGLGLTIAGRLVNLMNGEIQVASQPNVGSTFSFTARFGKQAVAPTMTLAQPLVILQNLPVLVVDDNATSRRVLAEWLRGWHMRPDTVSSGLAALDALWHGTSCRKPYALVLLDARMPDTDGLALAARIRQRPELAATRIILMTAGDRPGDLNFFRDHAITAHLVKPIQQEELLETIQRVMGRTGSDNTDHPHREASVAKVTASATRRILVAEDNEFNSQLLEQLLQRRGHQVQTASDGRETLELLKDGTFDLLLLDVHMPELDGFQVIRAIREREQTSGGHLPVIALTARSREEDRQRCLQAGMDDFLSKPIRAATLWAAIDHALLPLSLAQQPATALLDPPVLLAACGEDPVILASICETFRARLPDHLLTIEQALKLGKTDNLREAAHKLCGMIAAFSTRAAAVASELEDVAVQGELVEALPLVERLRGMVQALVQLSANLTFAELRRLAGLASIPTSSSLRARN